MADEAVKATSPGAPIGRGVPIGTVNVLEAFVGFRGMGKSTFLCEQVAEFVQSVGGAYVIGHSMGARLPERLPDGGHVLPIDYHEDVGKLARGLRRNPSRWHIVASETIPADAVIRYARDLSRQMREELWRRQHPLRPFNATRRLDGWPMIPIVVIIDEGIAVDAANAVGGVAGEENKWFKAWLFSLRHEHTAVYYAIQNANARSYVVIEQASAVHAFRTRHEWALNAVRAGAGASQEDVIAIRDLPKHRHLTFR